MEKKLYSVQYLRGIAALFVVIAHAAAHPLTDPVYILDRFGQLGVTLFFVISGFIMVAITGPGPIAAGSFLKRRIIRVVPLYWLFTSLAAALAVLAPALFKTTVFTWPHYIQSLLFIPHEAPARGGTSPLLSLGWTLNYEMFFYLVFALCAPLRATLRVGLITGGFLILALAGPFLAGQGGALAFYSNHALLAFCAGTWVGLAYVHGRFSPPSPRVVRLAISAAALGLVYALGIDRDAGDSVPAFFALMLFSTAILCAGLASERWLPRWRGLEALGDASYATYLVHMFVVGAAVAIADRLFGIGSPAVYLTTVALAVVAAHVAGLGVHRFIELPLLGLFRTRKRPPDLQAPQPARG